jgi:hypothetical protein
MTDRLTDIAVDNPVDPSIMQVTIKQSKTDPFWKGLNIFIGKTNTDICPVSAVLRYFLLRGKNRGDEAGAAVEGEK